MGMSCFSSSTLSLPLVLPSPSLFNTRPDFIPLYERHPERVELE